MERARLIAWLSERPEARSFRGRVLLLDPEASPARLAEARAAMEAWPIEGPGSSGCLALATGGTGGQLKLVRHDESTLSAAVSGFQRHFGIHRVNTIETLPSYHVSGLLSRLRSWSTGGQGRVESWKAWLEEVPPPWPEVEGGWVVSLVPTQLQRLLQTQSGREVLRRFSLILLGGAPAWPALVADARAQSLPVAPCYGMSETAAMVAALRPSDFLAGQTGVGHAFPEAQLSLNADGVLTVKGPMVFRGYVGGPDVAGEFTTEDLAECDHSGSWTILGRRDDVILTGGLKVSASWLESQLREMEPSLDVAILGLPNQEWGQEVVAAVPQEPSERLRSLVELSLAGYQRPKRWVVVEPWPRDARGKLDRSALRRHCERV